MSWTHLPNAGGIYDQDPELLDKFKILWSLQNEHEREKQARQKSEQNRKAGRRGLRGSR